MAHGLLAVGVGELRPDAKAHAATAISMSEAKPKPKPEPPKPIDPPKPLERSRAAPQRAKAAPAEAPKTDATPPKAAAANAALDGLPDFGVSLSGGVGPGGMAIPSGGGGPVAAAAAGASPTRPHGVNPTPHDECTEAPVKPKVISLPQPAYTPGAREAGVEGRVRIEVSVDAQGKVTSARLLAGLGHGLDEAALAAARAATFTPGQRCGKAASATFVIAMRFAL